jgi:lipopolysaccharide export system permease protein
VKVLERYVLKEMVAPFFGALAFLTFLLLLDRIFDLLDLLLRKGVPGRDVLELFVLALPSIFSLTVPMAVLVSVLVAFGRLSGDFEIIAIKSSGIPVRRILLPPLLLAVFIFLLLVPFDSYILPEANHRMKNLVLDIHQMKPALKIKAGQFNKIDRFRIYTKEKDDRTSTLYDVKIQEITEDGRLRTIIAKRARLRTRGDILEVALYDGEIHEAEGKEVEEYRRISFREHLLRIPFESGLRRRERSFRTDREMSIEMLLKSIEDTKRELRELKRRERSREEFLKRKIRKFLVEVHKKFALPFASIVFVLFGLPISILNRDKGYGTAIGLSFPIFTLYYVFLVGGESLAEKGLMAPWLAMWLPNAILFFAAIFLLKRSEK